MRSWWKNVGTAAAALALGVVSGSLTASASITEPPGWSRLLGTSGHDQAVAVATSSSAVFTAGYTGGAMPGNSNAGGFDVFLTRHTEGGSREWLRQFGTSSNDYVTGLAVHDRDLTAVSLYVTGYTGGALHGNPSAGGQDAFLVKLDAAGTRLWTHQLGTSAGDYAQGVATDADGHVYVTGYTSGALHGNPSAGGQDLFLVKYDASGARLWTRQLGTAQNEQARGVAVDVEGHVYVAGFTWGGLDGNPSAGGQDFFLVKYDASGARLWTRQLGTSGHDVVQGVATSRRTTGEVDVYVVGRTAGGADGRGLDGNPQLGDYDIVVVRYDASGTRLWTRQTGTRAEDSASGVTSDGAGNVYVTGSVSRDLETGTALAGNDLVLLKYGRDGTRRAARQLGSTAAASTPTPSDWGLAVAADLGTGVYVAGFAEGGLGGTAGAGGKDAALVRYTDGCERDTPGQCRLAYGWGRKSASWSRQLGTAFEDGAESVARASDGSVYLVGQTLGSLEGNTHQGGQDALLVKHDASGNPVWMRQLGTPEDDSAQGVAVSGDGLVYVAGTTSGALEGEASAGSLDVFLACYEASGTLRWAHQFGTSGFDGAMGVATDASGRVYVAGTTDGSLEEDGTATGLGGGDLFLASFEADGTLRWVRQLGTEEAEATAGVAVGPDGAIYLTGHTAGTLAGANQGGWDVVVARFDADGTRRWVTQYGTSGDEYTAGIAAVAPGRVHVTGSTTGAVPGYSNAGAEDLLLLWLDAASGHVDRVLQTGTSGTDIAGGLAADRVGNSFLVGSTQGILSGGTSQGGQDIVLLKHDASGALQWQCQQGTPMDEHARGLAVDAAGDFTLAGSTYGTYGDNTSQGDLDVLLLHHATAGASPCP
ncbi:SBBP repeat-containing protein [Archangium gephyra]|uniref:SBBP repeat-containing protein n=1 Tax=Archangium gephyra TaxID=48 RepID=UPI003B77085D